MVSLRFFACVAASAALWQSANAQVITGFGSLETNPFNTSTDFLSPWTGTQTSTTLSITNVPNGGSGGIYQDLSSSPITLNTSVTSIVLTGIAQVVPTITHFDIVFYDANAKTMTASFNWSSFSGSGATIAADVVSDPAFNGTVAAWGLTLFGTPSENVSFTFDNLEAVPEPTATALFASAGFVLLAWRVRGTSRRI